MKNIWTGKRRGKAFPWQLAIIAAAAAFTVMSVSDSRKAQDVYRVQSVKESISKAAALCYSAEGSYPENLEYLEDNYGITVNRDKYVVHYSYAGANIPPDVIVTAVNTR